MKKFIKLELILLFIILTTSLLSCTDTSKKVTISNNTEYEILIEDNQVSELINKGKNFLSNKKYNEAKINFIRAISLNNENKDIYLQIKDLYLNSNRLDDAYYIIKIALLNNVDTENMNIILTEISSKLDVINISETVTQNSSYSLPNDINIDINNNKISLPIFWLNSKVDTSQLGTFKYEGINNEYGRKIEMEIVVTANKYTTEYGYIKNIYKQYDKLYADIDLVEYFTGDEAISEAIKDNSDEVDLDSIYFDGPYYKRNNSSKITTYELDTSFAYCEYYPGVYAPLDGPAMTRTEHRIIKYSEFLDQYKDTLISNPDKSYARISTKNNKIYAIYRNDFYFEWKDVDYEKKDQ